MTYLLYNYTTSILIRPNPHVSLKISLNVACTHAVAALRKCKALVILRAAVLQQIGFDIHRASNTIVIHKLVHQMTQHVCSLVHNEFHQNNRVNAATFIARVCMDRFLRQYPEASLDAPPAGVLAIDAAGADLAQALRNAQELGDRASAL
jgi:metal-dependent HD superfamily phosphatase/phosphodiesterase